MRENADYELVVKCIINELRKQRKRLLEIAYDDTATGHELRDAKSYKDMAHGLSLGLDAIRKLLTQDGTLKRAMKEVQEGRNYWGLGSERKKSKISKENLIALLANVDEKRSLVLTRDGEKAGEIIQIDTAYGSMGAYDASEGMIRNYMSDCGDRYVINTNQTGLGCPFEMLIEFDGAELRRKTK